MSTSPRRLGKYELQQRLGQGGMAEVWKAFDPQLQRYVAIKLLHANLQADPNFITRFQREAQLIASLHHPNIVNIHDFQVAHPPESDSPIAYMVMDYVEGQTLADYIRNTSSRGQLLSPPDIVNLFTSISLAIDYAHQRGMIHRDIKPANILLDKRGTLRNLIGEPILTDFGVAKLLGVSSSAFSGALLGTPLYISPEQAQGLPGNERSDLYSLGVILYEMITGVTPFRGDTPIAVMSQHITAMPPSPSLINPHIPPAVTAVILRSLAKDPNARFPSASAMTIALAEALNVPVPERLGPPTYLTNPMNAPTLANPSSSSRSSAPATTPAVIGGPTLANVGQTAPAATPAQAYPVTIPGGPTFPPTPQAPSPQVPSSVSTPPSAPGRRPGRLYSILAVLLILVLIGSALGAYFVFFRNSTGNIVPPSSVVGHAFFVSSGQLNPGSAQGIADELEIDLQNIPDPHPGKSYYAWLLGDTHPGAEAQPLEPPLLVPPPILLTRLSVNHGTVHFLYPGDSQHDNLFSVTSRLLITEEDANATPKSPSSDRSTWRYYAQIPQTPYGPKHLSALDHIRHLFYKETKVAVLGLPGGLDIWLLRDTEKLLEGALAARDDWPNQINLMHDQFVGILDYLDGTTYIQSDVPPGTALVADPVASQVALLEFDKQHQSPPGYLFHIALHLNGVISAPDATPQMRKIAAQIISALNNATFWLEQVHKDAKQLANMTTAQLAQPATLSLLDDLVTQAAYAYIGRLDPSTNQTQPAVLQVHYDVQQLATLTIMKM